jgi:hypothetical protein
VTEQQTSRPDVTPAPRLGPDRTVLAAVAAVTAVSLAGAAVSVAGDLNPTYLDALGPDGHLSVPLPMTAFQVTVAVASGFFDGGYADDRLTGSQRAVQVVLVAGLVAVAALGARRFVSALRGDDAGAASRRAGG